MPTGSEPLIIERVVADSDLDGLIAASILKRAHPNAEVRFSHAAQVRSGSMDAYIDRTTALCDLPFHPACGVHFDHHRTNRAKVRSGRRSSPGASTLEGRTLRRTCRLRLVRHESGPAGSRTPHADHRCTRRRRDTTSRTSSMMVHWSASLAVLARAR